MWNYILQLFINVCVFVLMNILTLPHIRTQSMDGYIVK